VAQRAPKVDEKLELEKSSNGLPKIDEYIVKLQRHYEHHGLLTLDKKLDLATKGLKKHFKSLGTFVEDTAIPDEKGRCEREGEPFSIETALFIILKEFRSYMGARPTATLLSSDESSDEDGSRKKPKKHSKKRKLRNEKESNSNNNNNHSRRNLKDKDKADPKDKGSRKNGDENEKPTCHICKSEDHLMNDCPNFDPNFKKNKKPRVAGDSNTKKRTKGQFNMIRHSTNSGLFCGHCKLEDSEELIVQFDTGAEDSNYCSEEFAKLAESKGNLREPFDHSVKLADGKTALCLTHEIEVTVTLCFTSIGREDKQIKIKCAILPTLPYMLTLGAKDISAHDLLSDLAVLAAFKKQGFWNAIKGSSTGKLGQVEPSKGAIVTPAKVGGAKDSMSAKVGGAKDSAPTVLSSEQASATHGVSGETIPLLSKSSGNNAGEEGGEATIPAIRATTIASKEAPPKVIMESISNGFKLVSPPGDDDEFEVQEVLSDSCSDMQFEKISWGGVKNEVARQIVQILKEFEDVFSEQVSSAPCTLEPYKIVLKKGVAFPPKAMLQNVRPQTAANEAFIREKLKKWLDLGVIRKVSSRYWSQVHIVNKTGKSPRFCIDWRALNALVELFQYPIPDIKKTLSNLKNHKFYGTLDLTDAYTQLLMDPSSVEYTAFRVLEDIFVMDRLGFGHNGAVAHFQKEIATKVLKGLTG
jgi:hypothetical protein